MQLLQTSFGELQVCSITNYLTNDGIDGSTTRLGDFTIWSADGP